MVNSPRHGFERGTTAQYVGFEQLKPMSCDLGRRYECIIGEDVDI